MSFKLQIDLDNDAFEGDPRPELSRLLTQVALRVQNNATAYEGTGKIQDTNGNYVGRWDYLVEE